MLHYPYMQQRLSGTICPTDAVIDKRRFVFFIDDRVWFILLFAAFAYADRGG